jgi:hypothetical protein
MEFDEISRRRMQSKAMCRAPTCASERPALPVCTRDAKCQGCPYPAHGFVCWSQDGQCMRTILQNLNEKR